MFGTDRCTRILRGSRGLSGGSSSSRPKSKEETRRAVKGCVRRTEEDVLEKAKEARAALDETIKHGKHVLAEKAVDVEAAVKAGRETMKGKMEGGVLPCYWSRVFERSC